MLFLFFNFTPLYGHNRKNGHFNDKIQKKSRFCHFLFKTGSKMGLNVKNDDKIFKIQKFCHLKAIRQYKSTTRIDVSQNDSTFGNTALIFSIC